MQKYKIKKKRQRFKVVFSKGLETEVGLITLKEGVGTKAHQRTSQGSPRNLEIIEAESAHKHHAYYKTLTQLPSMVSMAQDAGLKIEDNIFSDANHLDTIPKDQVTTSLLLKQQMLTTQHTKNR